MTETTRAQCPACGANIEDDGRIKVIECAYCRTNVTIRRDPAPPPPPPKPRPKRTGRAWRIEEEEHASARLSPAFEEEARETAKGLRRGWGFIFVVGLIAGAVVYAVYFCIASDFGGDLEAWKQEAYVALIPAGIVGFFASLFMTIYLLMTD